MTPPETPNPRLARIRRNLAKLKAANAPQEDIDAYLATERVTPEQELAQMPRTAMEDIRGGVQSALQGATFNFGDEIAAAGRALTGENFGDALADERASLRGFREANPKTALGLELGGGLATGIPLGRAAVAGARTIPAAATRLAAGGVGGGAIAGVGAGETAGERVALGALGAGVGAALPAVAGKVATSRVGDAAARGMRRVGSMADDAMAALARAARPMAAEVAEDVTGQAAAQAPDALGQMLNRPGSVTMLDEAMPDGVNVPAARAVMRTVMDAEQGTAPARAELQKLMDAGMGDEALLLNVGGESAARGARAVANAPSMPFARTSANDVLGGALARQGAALGNAVADDIGRVTGMGGTPGPIALRDMQDELSRRTGEAFETLRVIPEVPLDPSDEAQRLFIEEFVNPVIANRRTTGSLTNASALSGDVVDEAFKNLQREVRGIERAVDEGRVGTRESGRLRALRDRILGVIEGVAPDYGNAVRQYALDEDVGKVVQRGFDAGLQLPSQPVGTFTAATRGEIPQVADAMRRGAATRLQAAATDAASNADLGEVAKFRNVAESIAGRQGQAERFKEIFGEDAYTNLMTRLTPKVRAAALNAIVRGNSTTTRQLLDAMAMGDNAVMDILQAATTQGPVAAALRFGTNKLLDPARAAATGMIGETATEAAKLFSARGPQEITGALDLFDRVARMDAARRAAVRPAAGAATRTITNRAGGQPSGADAAMQAVGTGRTGIGVRTAPPERANPTPYPASGRFDTGGDNPPAGTIDAMIGQATGATQTRRP